jgi:hypothetical protein
VKECQYQYRQHELQPSQCEHEEGDSEAHRAGDEVSE